MTLLMATACPMNSMASRITTGLESITEPCAHAQILVKLVWSNSGKSPAGKFWSNSGHTPEHVSMPSDRCGVPSLPRLRGMALGHSTLFRSSVPVYLAGLGDFSLQS